MYYATCCCGAYTPNCDCEGFQYAKVSCRVSLYYTPIGYAIRHGYSCDELCRVDQAFQDQHIASEYGELTTYMKCANNSQERTEFRSDQIPDSIRTYDPDNFVFYKKEDLTRLRTFNHLDLGCETSPGSCSEEQCENLLGNCCNYGSTGNIVEAAGRWLYYERVVDQSVVTDGHSLRDVFSSACQDPDSRPEASSRTFVGRREDMPVPGTVIQQLDPDRFYRYIVVSMTFCQKDARNRSEVDSLDGPWEPYYNSSYETLDAVDSISCWQINDIGDECDGAAVGTPIISSDWNGQQSFSDSETGTCPPDPYGPGCCGEGVVPEGNEGGGFTVVRTQTDVVFGLEFMDEPPDPW